MRFILNSQRLFRELALAHGAVDAKTTIPMLKNVLLEAEGDQLTLTATNMDLAFRSSCEAVVEDGGSIAVPMRWLHDYVRLLPDADMAIKAVPGDAIEIKCGSARTRIPCMEAGGYPQLRSVPERFATITTNVLLTALKRTIGSVATEQSHYTLAGALLKVGGGAVGIVSTDGHRLSLYSEQHQSTDAIEEVEGLVGRKAMAELIKVLEQSLGSKQRDGVDFSFDEKHLFFQCGPRLFFCRKMTGKFPDYKRVMPRDLDITLELDSEKLTAMLRRVMLFTDERSGAVKFDLEDDRLDMAATGDVSSSEESILVEYEGDPFGVGFKGQYILDFLAVCESEKVLMRLKDPRSAAQFEVPGTSAEKDYRYVVMPIRV